MSRLYIFDLDGTLFRGSEPTPNAPAVIDELRRQGSQLRFLTNNSARTPDELAAKLWQMGFNVDVEEIFTSSLGAASALRGQVDWAFVVGEHGLVNALWNVNIYKGPADGPGAVVAGICRHFTYDLMKQAMQLLLDPEIRFVATNTDATYPLEQGKLEPGAGSIVAALAACSGRTPEVIGKPSPYLIDLILSKAGVAPKDCVVVGDRLDTDIEAGHRAGCETHLVLCGVTKEAPAGQRFSEDLRGLI